MDHTQPDNMSLPCWIGPANWQDQVKPDTQYPYALRKVITLDQPVSHAKLNITAAWRYNLWINGKFINHGPARSFPEHMLYDELDITTHLSVGKNVIAIMLIPATGVTGYTTVTRSGLWCDGKITCNNQPSRWSATPAGQSAKQTGSTSTTFSSAFQSANRNTTTGNVNHRDGKPILILM